MFERLDQIEARYEELTKALASHEIVSESSKFQKTAKAHSEIAPIVEKYREYKDLKKGIAESKAVLAEEKDAEMRAYAQEELDKLQDEADTILGVAIQQATVTMPAAWPIFGKQFLVIGQKPIENTN